tara:strand:+ start:4317 stop:5630 length:1314 start_codon:yes stop_codon:yes gene_type:complete
MSSLSQAARGIISGRQAETISEETKTPQNSDLPAEGAAATQSTAPKARAKVPGPPPVSTTVKPTGGVNSDDAKKVAHSTKRAKQPQNAQKGGEQKQPLEGSSNETTPGQKNEDYYDEDEEMLETLEEDEDRPEGKAIQAKSIFDALRELAGDDLDGKYDAIMSYIQETLSEEDDENYFDVDEVVQSEVTYITADDLDVTEDVYALVGEEDLSEEFMSKAKTVFEGAVVSKVNEKIDEIHAAYENDLEETVTAFAEELTEKVDGYLSYVVEEWMNENELAIESGIKSEVTEDFINGLKALFTEHYIDIPDERVDVVNELANKVDELEDGLNESIERNIDLQQDINESRKFEILVNSTDGLADTQIEKLQGLAEGVDFEDAEQYQEAISTLKESYFPKAPRTIAEDQDVDESLLTEEYRPTLEPTMAAYASVLGRTVKK